MTFWQGGVRCVGGAIVRVDGQKHSGIAGRLEKCVLDLWRGEGMARGGHIEKGVLGLSAEKE